jgi:LPS-assembly protein
VVSDQNYMRDFQDGPTGFDVNREEFLEAFGRDIDNKDSTTRTSVAYASRSWDRFGATGMVKYVENLEFMNGNGRSDENTTVQTLPELGLFAYQQEIPGTPLEVSANAKYDYFTRNKGHTGHRFRMDPELKLPLTSDYITFIPSVSGDFTAYDLTKHEGTATRPWWTRAAVPSTSTPTPPRAASRAATPGPPGSAPSAR